MSTNSAAEAETAPSSVFDEPLSLTARSAANPFAVYNDELRT